MNGAWPGRPVAPPPRNEFDEENIMDTALAWAKWMQKNGEEIDDKGKRMQRGSRGVECQEQRK